MQSTQTLEPSKKKHKFESLKSLARRCHNFAGFFRVIPVFLKEEDHKKVDDIVQDRDLTKILKIEIKRIMTEDQFV